MQNSHIKYLSIAATMLTACATSENTLDTTLGHIQVEVAVAGTIPEGDAIALTITSSDGKYTNTWDNYKDFSALEGYYAGSYTAKAIHGTEGAEGFGCPCYIGREEFEVADNRLTTVNITCSLSQAMVQVNCTEDFDKRFPEYSTTLHSEGYSYVEVPRTATSPVYLMPGSTEIFVTLLDNDNNEVTVATGLEIETDADKQYTVTLDFTDETLVTECGGKKSSFPLTKEILSAAPPAISCIGFTDGKGVLLTEGFPSTNNLIMYVDTPVKLAALSLTTSWSDQANSSWPSECNLLSDADPLLGAGLEIDTTDPDCIKVDFTRLIENLSISANTDVTFLLQATDALGRVSNVASLIATIRGVEIKSLQITPAVIGEDIATITLSLNEPNVEAKDFSLYIDDGQSETPLHVISSSTEDNSGMITMTLEVPEGLSPVPVRIDYMGKEKMHADIGRMVPEYSINVDAFATTIMANIIAETPEITSAITKYAHILANGKEIAILKRDTENGILYCAGLNQSTVYTLESKVMESQYIASKTIKTEKATPIPDGDFEDVEEIIGYEKFPSGGKYSATSFSIFNQQNFVNLNVYWPKKHWASINAKTFCTKAKNYNTWYMQPSAMADFSYKISGNKSISISSVGWSLDGEDIPSYVQAKDSFLPYNPNIPAIGHISAGYLFLGSYRFNYESNTETYIQGISFGSRPSSLNGYFKYLPDLNTPTDCGWVKVEVINIDSSGKETVLASSKMEFPNAPDFRAFNLPLDYEVFYLPATAVRVMFCTSTRTDGISQYDPDVPVSADVSNSRFIGSTLWIDGLSFSY